MEGGEERGEGRKREVGGRLLELGHNTPHTVDSAHLRISMQFTAKLLTVISAYW